MCNHLQVQVSTNQLRRQDDENKKLRESIEQTAQQERDHHARMREQLHRYSLLETQMKEQKLLNGIKEAENTQSVAELTQKISRLQMKVKQYEIKILKLIKNFNQVKFVLRIT